MRESEQRFRLIADSAPVPMWVTRLDRKREFVNRAYCEFIGVPYDEALDFDWRHIIHPDDIARIYREQVEKEASLKPFSLEARFRNAAGEWRWLRTRIAAALGRIRRAFRLHRRRLRRHREQSRDGRDAPLERHARTPGRAAHAAACARRKRNCVRCSRRATSCRDILSLDGRLLEANARALDAMGANT